tara:strand:- start:168 stop:764 length:597 start_codon:yes stop_codon:yes gene_type:complete
MEHIYKSIEIKDYLYSFFPLPDLAIELVIKNLKLAVDLNGYTNEMLKLYIKQHKIVDVNKYLRKKYGKYRSNLGLLKRYQLIKVIQHFDIPVPLKPYKIDIIDKYLNDNGIRYENKNIYVGDKLYVFDNIITLGKLIIDIKADHYIVRLGNCYFKNNKIEYKNIIFLYCYYNIIENRNIEIVFQKNKIINQILYHNYI